MRNKNPGRAAALLVLATAIAAFGILTGPAGVPRLAGNHTSASCSANPDPVAAGAPYTVSARGLPTGSTVNLIITEPNGTTLTGPINVAKDGTASIAQPSITPTVQIGTFTYQFVGRVTWPAGSFKMLYATCTELVTA